MIKYLDKIFIESDLTKQSFNDEQSSFYSLNNVAYYFILELEWDGFTQCNSYSGFESLSKYKTLKEAFDLLEANGESGAVEKNSSLLVLIKAPTLESIEACYQQVLLLEEDEYFFKKYVIIYSENSINDLPEEGNLMPHLESIVNKKENFDRYMNTGYHEDLEQYLLTLQLFIKLPFLNLSSGDTAFQSLEERLIEKLGSSDSKIYDSIIESEELIEDIDFTSHDDEDKIDQLLKLLDDDTD